MAVRDIFKSRDTILDEIIEESEDYELLEKFMRFLPRVNISTHALEDEHGFITHEYLSLQCGEYVIKSPPIPYQWPMEMVRTSRVPKKDMN